MAASTAASDRMASLKGARPSRSKVARGLLSSRASAKMSSNSSRSNNSSWISPPSNAARDLPRPAGRRHGRSRRSSFKRGGALRASFHRPMHRSTKRQCAVCGAEHLGNTKSQQFLAAVSGHVTHKLQNSSAVIRILNIGAAGKTPLAAIFCNDSRLSHDFLR